MARHRHDRRRQLAGQAVLDGAAGLDLHRASVPALAAGRSDRRATSAGLILLAAAPCTAMVFVWSNLVDGEPHFTLSQVALNDTIMVVAFAPIVGAAARPLLDHRAMGHALPFGRALHRRAGDRGAALARGASCARRSPASLAAPGAVWRRFRCARCCSTLVLLFGLQGEQIMRQPLVIVLLAVPIVIQVYFNAGLLIGSIERSASNGASPVRRRSSAPAISSSLPSRRRSSCSAFNRAPRSRPWSACWSKCRSCCRSCASCAARAAGMSAGKSE